VHRIVVKGSWGKKALDQITPSSLHQVPTNSVKYAVPQASKTPRPPTRQPCHSLPPCT